MACIPQGFTLTCPLPSYIVRLFGRARKSTIGPLSASTYTRRWGYRLIGLRMGEPRREQERSPRKRRKVDRSVDWGRGREPLRGERHYLLEGFTPLLEAACRQLHAALVCSAGRDHARHYPLSRVDEECLRNMGDELLSTPIDAFMDVCLSRLRFTTSIPSPNSSSNSGGASAPFPKYYLAPFFDLDQCDASSLDPSRRALFFASARYRLVVRRRALRRRLELSRSFHLL
ncbi:hypothetical protein B0H14DRAFT_470829 [Mycena olivaceomarginata]|nr:hypothetical protein B0H14DRAFT_470829 [Mycena olivaceomarginata]